SIEGGGELDLAAESTLDFELASTRLDRLIALISPTPVEGLEGSIAGSVELAIDPAAALTAKLEIPALEFRLGARSIRSLEPVAARIDGDGVTIESLYLGRADSDDELFVSGRASFGDPGALDLNVEASLAAEWLAPFVAGIDFGGRVDALAKVRGT